MQMVLGTVYAWSVFKAPFLASHDWTPAQFTFTFTLMIGFLGLSAAFGGRFVDSAGARKVALVSALLFPAATVMAGLAHRFDSLWLLWLGYGVLGGIGNGMGYITPIAVLVRWFPERRGLITGLAVMGFGLGAAIMGQAGPRLVDAIGLQSTFLFSGALFLVVMLVSAFQMGNPPDSVAGVAGKVRGDEIPSRDLAWALRTPQFYLLWVVLFLNITAGIALISNHSPLVRSQAGVDAATAGTLVALGALFNGLGRIFWSSLSDRLGRKMVFAIILGSQVPVFLVLGQVENVILLAVLGCYILACYGGGFSTMPAYIADTYGMRNMGSIYGKVLLAWSAAGIVGPSLMELLSRSDEATGQQEFTRALLAAAGILVAGFLLNLFYRKPAPDNGAGSPSRD
ncbi:MAG: OFA family MFS transporter [Pseudomonadota bacterium]